MRVLRISHSATVGPWRARERALRDRGVDVRVIAARRWHAGGVPVALGSSDAWAVPASTIGTHPALVLYSPAPLWHALGQQWDVIDIHEEPYALATLEVRILRWLRRQRAPYVLYSAQNIAKRYPPPFRWFERSALRAASGLSVCNTEAGEICEAKGFPGRARVIPLGVDAGALPHSERQPPAVDAPVVVGFVGRLVEEKGLWVLLDAVAGEPRLRARIAGAGPLSAEIGARAVSLGVTDRVEVVGAVDPGEIGSFYGSVDVLAVPSLPTPSWTEQFGRAAVEAMACGVPVVASDAGALPDVVGGAGIVVAHGNASALADALIEATGVRREELRSAGVARAAGCSWDAVAGQYQQLYARAVGTAAATATRDRDVLELIVVAYGAPDLLRRTLTPVASLPVTVIDNSSSPEIAALCTELGIRYRDARANLGFGRAVNLVLSDRLHPGADVLLLNPDAVVSVDDIVTLQRALGADPRLASVGPLQVDEAGRPAHVRWPFPSPFGSWVDALGLGRLRRDKNGFVIGSVLLLRFEALEQVGGFDERFFLYAEETDWAYRAHLQGWRHGVAPEIEVVHSGAGTSTDPRRREALFFASQERYLRKHFGAAGWASARVAGWLGASIRSLLLSGDRGVQARRRAALLRLGPVRVEQRFRDHGGG